MDRDLLHIYCSRSIRGSDAERRCDVARHELPHRAILLTSPRLGLLRPRQQQNRRGEKERLTGIKRLVRSLIPMSRCPVVILRLLWVPWTPDSIMLKQPSSDSVRLDFCPSSFLLFMASWILFLYSVICRLFLSGQSSSPLSFSFSPRPFRSFLLVLRSIHIHKLSFFPFGKSVPFSHSLYFNFLTLSWFRPS